MFQYVDLIQKAFSSLAMLVASLWVYYTYFRGRTFRDHLELELTGTIQREGEIEYLTATIRVKNVGLSRRVVIQQKGSGLRLFTCQSINPDYKFAEKADWDLVTTFPIFEEHEWVEPGESVSDQHLFILPTDNSVAIKLALQLVSKTQMWRNTSIIIKPPKKEKE